MARCYIGRGLEISIHALREEGDRIYFDVDQYGVIRISIHALREEGDRIRPRIEQGQIISIHALREEGDLHG